MGEIFPSVLGPEALGGGRAEAARGGKGAAGSRHLLHDSLSTPRLVGGGRAEAARDGEVAAGQRFPASGDLSGLLSFPRCGEMMGSDALM